MSLNSYRVQSTNARERGDLLNKVTEDLGQAVYYDCFGVGGLRYDQYPHRERLEAVIRLRLKRNLSKVFSPRRFR